jgi:DNA-binding MarR family transcriptional regulator
MGSGQRKATKRVEALSDDEVLSLDNQLCFALEVATRQVVRAYRPAFKELGITHPQYLVLLVLWEWERQGELNRTVKALGERLYLDSGTLTPLLKRMAANGLVTRSRSSVDEREVHIHLTAAGRALKKRAACVPRALLKQSPVQITELIKLRQQLKALRAAMDAADIE